MVSESGPTRPDVEDERLFHERMQTFYLTHYETPQGGRFSIDAFNTRHQAQWNASLFIDDGYPARIVKVTVENGQPVAEWAG